MKLIAATAMFALFSLAAYAEEPATPTAPVTTSPQTAAAPSDAEVAPGKWDVERVRCAGLLGATDDDRASAAMFYYGYLAAKAGINVIDVGKISDNIEKVMKQCSTTPEMAVPQAFRQALAPSQ